jgi:predicted RNA polymerase sigma factor
MHRAIAVRYTAGPQAAMSELDTLAKALDGYHLYHATRADLLRELGNATEARAANRRALQLTANPAEREADRTCRHRLPGSHAYSEKNVRENVPSMVSVPAVSSFTLTFV